MNKIKCECGNTIVLDYSRAKVNSNNLIYHWACKLCGQIYYEELKPDIKITADQIITDVPIKKPRLEDLIVMCGVSITIEIEADGTTTAKTGNRDWLGGKTPIEAVENLFKSLNKKKDDKKN